LISAINYPVVHGPWPNNPLKNVGFLCCAIFPQKRNVVKQQKCPKFMANQVALNSGTKVQTAAAALG
jgi:hypothetical protein